MLITSWRVPPDGKEQIAPNQREKVKTSNHFLFSARFCCKKVRKTGEYVNPYNGKKMSVMLRTDYDDEVTKLLDAIGVKT